MPDDRAQATTPTGIAAPPIVTGDPQEIADGVFLIPDGRVALVPNIGVIVGDRAALVVDTGLGPRSAARVHRLARELAGDRPLFLTLTHFHPEHGWGAQEFTDATIIYNRSQHQELREKSDGFFAMFRGLGEAVAEELSDVRLVDPQIVYDREAELDLGGTIVELRSVGPAHSRGDQLIHLPAQRIVFAGDLAENRFFPIFPPHDPDVDGGHWIDTLEALEGLAPQAVVPGHGELGDAGLLAINRDYLVELRSETRRLAGEGADADAIAQSLIPQMLGRHPDWDRSEPWRIATGVQSFAR